MSSQPRRSLGGVVVENSLRRVGFDLVGHRSALVETQRPGSGRFFAVLAQNAWNVVPDKEFTRLASPYPARMVARMRLRRVVAAVNLRRAERVVCLSAAMADLVRGVGVPAQRVTVAPAYLAMDMVERGPAAPLSASQESVLVPGTVTWYKSPAEALSIAAAREIRHVRFAGPDDGSGCWADVEAGARQLGLQVSRETLSREAMREALASAALVVLPSQLESLGFSLGEALSHAREVVATPLPAHREAADWMGRAPTWMPEVSPRTAAEVAPSLAREESVRACWMAVGESLGLRR